MMIQILAFLLFLFYCCDSVEDGYKAIKPLHTSKASVEKLLGKAEIDGNGYYMYSTDDALVRIDYSSVPCTANQYRRGEFDVPRDTVLTYSVLPKNEPKLSEIKFDRDKFRRTSSEHLLNYAAYVNADNSISVRLMIIEARDEVVYEIAYRPIKQDAEKLKCK
jgi:hypothetical protein